MKLFLSGYRQTTFIRRGIIATLKATPSVFPIGFEAKAHGEGGINVIDPEGTVIGCILLTPGESRGGMTVWSHPGFPEDPRVETMIDMIALSCS